MDREDMKRWAADLRSGKYQQCRGSWRTPQAYCCLSVLQEVTMKGKPLVVLGDDDTSIVEERTRRTELNRTLVDVLGKDNSYFTSLNDHLYLTFPQIADKIDELLIEA